MATAKQMRTLDSLAIKAGLSIEQLMENAGRAVATVAKRVTRKKILVVCGKGNNGGDGLVASRFLANWGFDVSVMLAEKSVNSLSKRHLNILKILGVPISDEKDHLFHDCDLIIDALLGYGIRGDPKGPYASIVRSANNSGKKILSVDIPTGLDADSGKAYNPCIKASATVTLATMKNGLLKNRRAAGSLFVADIGIPKALYAKAGIKSPDFSKNDILKA